MRPHPRLPGLTLWITVLLAAVTAAVVLAARGGPTERIAADEGQRPPASQLPPVARPVWRDRPGGLLPLGLTIADSRSIDLSAGEVQSTVVPPGLNTQCPQGRLLISNDGAKRSGAIAWLDLDNLDGAAQVTTVDALPDVDTTFMIASNDHDLVSLPGGDLLLVKMGRSREPFGRFRPIWFDFAYKFGQNGANPWGPGARTALFVWRSTDCGSHFDLVSSIDTGRITTDAGLFSGGLPQPSSSTAPPGSDEQPIWQMGGSDGPLVRVDPDTGRVYVTIGLFGHRPSSLSPFVIGGPAIDTTVVMASADRGSTWSQVTSLPFRGWRIDVVPRSRNRLAVGHNLPAPNAGSNPVAFVIPDLSSVWRAAPGTPGWDQSPWAHSLLFKYADDQGPSDTMQTNVASQSVLARSPSSRNLLFAYPDTIENGRGDGYRLFFHDGWFAWNAFAPIAPQTANPDNFVLHLTAVDPGRGPVLFYWYDVESSTRRVTMRGRIVSRDDVATVDFPVSRGDGAPRAFDVSTSTRWYGDYHTAGAYAASSAGPASIGNTFHYFPVWVEPDGDVHFAHLVYRPPVAVSAAAANALGYQRLSSSTRIIVRRAFVRSMTGVEPDVDEEEPLERVIPK